VLSVGSISAGGGYRYLTDQVATLKRQVEQFVARVAA